MHFLQISKSFYPLSFKVRKHPQLLSNDDNNNKEDARPHPVIITGSCPLCNLNQIHQTHHQRTHLPAIIKE